MCAHAHVHEMLAAGFLSTNRGLCFHICSDRLAEQEAYDIDVSTEGCQLQRGDTFGRAALHIRAYIWAEKHTERLKFSRLGGPMKRCAACSWAIGDNSGAREGREGGGEREREVAPRYLSHSSH